MEHNGTVTIETEKLILRPFTKEDANAAFNNWMNDEKVTEYLRWNAHTSISTSEQIISQWISNYKNLDFYQWAIVLKEINQPIGSISVVDKNEKTNMLHIGYCLGRKWWRMGYTSQAFSAVIKFLFEQVKAERIEAFHHPLNVGSGKVMQKCGLTYEGTLRKADWYNKAITDACVYSILAQEYFNKP